MSRIVLVVGVTGNLVAELVPERPGKLRAVQQDDKRSNRYECFHRQGD
jgi:hypothetical protein